MEERKRAQQSSEMMPEVGAPESSELACSVQFDTDGAFPPVERNIGAPRVSASDLAFGASRQESQFTKFDSALGADIGFDIGPTDSQYTALDAALGGDAAPGMGAMDPGMTGFDSMMASDQIGAGYQRPGGSVGNVTFGGFQGTRNDGIALPDNAQIDYDAANQQQPDLSNVTFGGFDGIALPAANQQQPDLSNVTFGGFQGTRNDGIALPDNAQIDEGGFRDDVETVLGANDARELYSSAWDELSATRTGGEATSAAEGAEAGGSLIGETFSAVSAGANFANAIDDGARGDYSGATAQALDGGLNAAAALGVEAAGIPAAVGGMIIEGEKATKESGLYGQFANGEQKSGMDVAMSTVTSAADMVHNAVGSTSMAGQLAGDLTEQALFAPAATVGAVYDFGAGVVSTADKVYDLGKRGAEAAGSAISAGWDWLTGGGAGPKQEDEEDGG